MKEICIQQKQKRLFASINYFGGSAASLRDADTSDRDGERGFVQRK